MKCLSLFEAFGIEIEYMIVERKNLNVAPFADRLLQTESGDTGDVVAGNMGWSNELCAHLIEIKNLTPMAIEELPTLFTQQTTIINQKLRNFGALLLPSGMHPLMNPKEETLLWPHQGHEIYACFDRIFHCKDHGWANIQSTHVNLPFNGDTEFAALHAAIRLLLPLLPGLAASSPLCEGRLSGFADTRLHAYRNNSLKTPKVVGSLIPEAVFTRKDYETNILAAIYQDLSAYDPDNIIQHEWVNARGAIPRFSRNAIEIRLLDVQECPQADLSIAALMVGVLKALVGQRWIGLQEQKAWPISKLVTLLRDTILSGHEAMIEDEAYLRAFNYQHAAPVSVQDLWRHLLDSIWPSNVENAEPWRAPLKLIMQQGTLSRRIVRALGKDTSHEHIQDVYRELADCLAQNRMFKI